MHHGLIGYDRDKSIRRYVSAAAGWCVVGDTLRLGSLRLWCRTRYVVCRCLMAAHDAAASPPHPLSFPGPPSSHLNLNLTHEGAA